MANPKDYEAIRIWHASTYSLPYYWKSMQERAAAENAPLDALFTSPDGRWITMADLRADHPFRETFERKARRLAGQDRGRK
jgi:hypothetical protein